MTTNDTQQIAEDIVSSGAILTLGEMHALIGYFEPLGPRRVFWFEAGGENQFAGHLLEFAKARAPHNLGVEFLDAEGRMLAYLCPIPEAGFDAEETARYQATFAFWSKELTDPVRGLQLRDFLRRTREELL